MTGERNEQNMDEYVTATVAGQHFGLPILRVQDVFVPERLARVPLAAPDIAGLLNLRGRIVTVIDMRRRLRLGPDGARGPAMAIGIESHGESYGLLVDSVGEVVMLDARFREANPVNLDPWIAEVSSGIYRLDDRLLVLIDVDRILGIAKKATAA
jgi:purine-binding chemotaxis protein CheW